MPIARVIRLPQCDICGRVSQEIICHPCIEFSRLVKKQRKTFQDAIACLSSSSQKTIIQHYNEIATLPEMLSYISECITMLRSRPAYQLEMRAVYARFQHLSNH